MLILDDKFSFRHLLWCSLFLLALTQRCSSEILFQDQEPGMKIDSEPNRCSSEMLFQDQQRTYNVSDPNASTGCPSCTHPRKVFGMSCQERRYDPYGHNVPFGFPSWTHPKMFYGDVHPGPGE